LNYFEVHVQVQRGTNLERTRVRNAMTDALIHRSAYALGKATVAERRRVSTSIDDHLMNSLIDLVRCHTWLQPPHQTSRCYRGYANAKEFDIRSE
jgi:hypothetical protein